MTAFASKELQLKGSLGFANLQTLDSRPGADDHLATRRFGASAFDIRIMAIKRKNVHQNIFRVDESSVTHGEVGNAIRIGPDLFSIRKLLVFGTDGNQFYQTLPIFRRKLERQRQRRIGSRQLRFLKLFGQVKK